MSLSLDEIRSVCTKAEYALISASRSPAIEKLSVVELKKNAANARKLSDKWQKLSRSQSRSESRKTGEPNLDSKSYAKQQAIHDALLAYEARLVTASATTTVTAAPKKLTPKQRTASARVSRQAARTDLQGVKKTLNKAAKTTARKAVAKPAATPATQSVAAPKPAASKPATKSAAAKTAAAKKTLVKTAAKRTAKRAAVASAAPASAPVKKVVKATAKTGVVVPTAAAKAQLAGKAKANRVKLSNRTSNIAGHVSSKGKRAQAKRDSKGR